ncbi:MAG: hypothetical protein ACHQ0J_12255 [Candidatus Dormibacterales bacterium]
MTQSIRASRDTSNSIPGLDSFYILRGGRVADPTSDDVDMADRRRSRGTGGRRRE